MEEEMARRLVPGRGGSCLPERDLLLVAETGAEMTGMIRTMPWLGLLRYIPHLLFKPEPNVRSPKWSEGHWTSLVLSQCGHIKQISFFCFSLLVSLIGLLRVVTNPSSLGHPGPGSYLTTPVTIPQFLHPLFFGFQGTFSFLAVVESATMTMGVHIRKYLLESLIDLNILVIILEYQKCAGVSIKKETKYFPLG